MIEGLNRRVFLKTAGAGAAGCLVLGQASLQAGTARMGSGGDDPVSTPLKTLAEQKGFLYGCEATLSELSDPPYKALVVSQADLLVPGLALKWDVLRPTPETFDFSQGDWNLNFARQNNMKLRGHTLVWWDALPKWFKGYATQQNAKQLMLNHINTVVTHYAGKMQSWDVINEALLPTDNRSDGLRNSIWLQLVGPDFIETAFRAAAAADPQAILCWNEYGIENESDAAETKRQAFLQNLRELRKRNVPVHAIGIQSHLDATDPKFPGEQFNRFLHQVSDMGLKIIVSELDFADGAPDPDVNHRSQVVAAKYQQYLDIVLKHRSTIAIVSWGLSDKHTWLNNGYRFPRKDGAPFVPLPFDANMNAKPAWQAIARSFENAPPR